MNNLKNYLKNHLRGNVDVYNFEEVMARIDVELSVWMGDTFSKAFCAFVKISGDKLVEGSRPIYNEKFDPMAGHELFDKIHKWYSLKYGSLGTLPGFGTRNFNVRGLIIKLKLPLGFNVDSNIYDPFKYFTDFPASLVAILTKSENEDIRNRFNTYFQMGSRLALLNVKIRDVEIKNASAFINRGREDLEAASDSFNARDPNPSLWSCQQAVEKYLKGFLLFMDESNNVDKIKNSYGHDLKKLARACAEIEPYFSVIYNFVDDFNFNASDRYLPPKNDFKESLDCIDQGYSTCDLVAQVLNKKMT